MTHRKVNILLLGETGVGKSTWINGFANHLRFQTLLEAEKAPSFFIVPTTFTIQDPNTFKQRTISTGQDENEHYEEHGQSVTESPVTYAFRHENLTINVIDTPGVESTHGSLQDRINAQHILKFLSAFEQLHAICIMLKPNQTRLTENFVNCITEVLRNLHDSACTNVVFCITNSKASNYKPGDTFTVLSKFFSNHSRLHQVELSPKNVYCVENETVRYLATLKHDKVCDPEDERSVYLSWDKSLLEITRFLHNVVAAEPHMVDDTLSLNNARKIIEALSRPLIETAKCIEVNLKELVRAKEKLLNSESSKIKLPGGKVEVIERYVTFVSLRHSANICISPKCTQIIDGMIISEKPCHDHCRWSPTLFLCAKIDLKGLCKVCGCSYKQHRWTTCRTEISCDRTVLDVDEIEKRKNASMEELITLIETSARLTDFLGKCCLIETVGDIISESLQQEIKALNQPETNEATLLICQRLQDYEDGYRRSVQALKEEGHDYSPSEIHVMIGRLFQLPLHGSHLQRAVEVIQRSTDAAIRQRKTVMPIDSWLLEKISQ